MEPEIQEGLKHMRRIEEELAIIRSRSVSLKRSFFYGLLQGAGAILGSVLAIALIGWALSIFGFIPGLSALATNLHTILNHTPSRL